MSLNMVRDGPVDCHIYSCPPMRSTSCRIMCAWKCLSKDTASLRFLPPRCVGGQSRTRRWLEFPLGACEACFERPVPPSSTWCCSWRCPRSALFGEEGGTQKNISELSKMASPSLSAYGWNWPRDDRIGPFASCKHDGVERTADGRQGLRGAPTGCAWVPLEQRQAVPQVQHVALGLRPSRRKHLHLLEYP